MMEHNAAGTEYRVDEHTLWMLTASARANLISVGLVILINVIIALRSAGRLSFSDPERFNLMNGVSPETVLILSVAAVFYFVVRFFDARQARARLKTVFLRIEGDTATGVSLPKPIHKDSGMPFLIALSDITDVSVGPVDIARRQTAPSLFIEGPEGTYVLPGLGDIYSARDSLTGYRERKEKKA